MSNVINAIINLVNNPVVKLVSYYKNKNRANSAGDALEEYMKDLFANSFDCSTTERLEKINQTFSYTGNSNNPPDAMLRNGDCIEVKKIENRTSALPLNSSYPKHKVYSSSDMISKNCREAEVWNEKDIIYSVGYVEKGTNQLRSLCMVYGLDYCASSECYDRLKSTIKNGIQNIPNVEFSESKELGHVNKVDPLGITYLRVRGMWGIENPWRVFNYVYERNSSDVFDFFCIINNSKWGEFDNTQQLIDLSESNPCLKICDVKIKNPDNPAQLVEAKLITFAMR